MDSKSLVFLFMYGLTVLYVPMQEFGVKKGWVRSRIIGDQEVVFCRKFLNKQLKLGPDDRRDGFVGN